MDRDDQVRLDIGEHSHLGQNLAMLDFELLALKLLPRYGRSSESFPDGKFFCPNT